MSSSNSQLSIAKIYGTSSLSESNFCVRDELVGYVASAGVVVCELDASTNQIISQRFFCANSNNSITSESKPSGANAYLHMISPSISKDDSVARKTDSYGFPVNNEPDMVYGSSSSAMENSNTSTASKPTLFNHGDSGMNNSLSAGSSKLSNKIRNINCISISPDKKLLAVGEVGYHPRILVYSLAPDSNLNPVYIINEHQFGIQNIQFAPDSKRLVSLGLINDGFINVWKLSNKKVTMIASNKCSFVVNKIIWQNYDSIITIGLRFIKFWTLNVDEDEDTLAKRVTPLRGKNVLLSNFLGCNFIDFAYLNLNQLILLTDQGDLCILELDELLPLKKLASVSPSTNRLLIDDDILWTSDKDIRKMSIESLLDKSNYVNDDPTASCNSPTKSQPSRSGILSFQKLNERDIIYLNSNEEIMIYDIEANHHGLLTGGFMNGLSGIKDSFDRKILIWSKQGIIKSLVDGKVEKLFEFNELESNDFVENSLTAVEISGEQLFLGDKYGEVYVFDALHNSYTLSQKIKAHSSTVNDISYFKIGDIRFFTSISRDRMIQVFSRFNDDSDWDLLQTIALHKGTLTKLIYHQGRIIVSSSDRSISIHKIVVSKSAVMDDLSTEFDLLSLGAAHSSSSPKINIFQEKVISDKNSPIAMEVHNGQLVVSTNDKCLAFYNLDLEFIEKNDRNLKLYDLLTNESLMIENFFIENDLIFVSSTDKSIRCFQLSNGKQLSCGWGHSDLVIGLKRIPEMNSFISISNDGCMFQWFYSHASTTNGDDQSQDPSVKNQRVVRKVLSTTPLTRRSSSSIKTPVTPSRSSPSKPTVTSPFKPSSSTNLNRSPSLISTPRLTSRSLKQANRASPTPPSSPTTMRPSLSTSTRMLRSPVKGQSVINKNSTPDLSLDNVKFSFKPFISMIKDLNEKLSSDGNLLLLEKENRRQILLELRRCLKILDDDSEFERQLLGTYSEKLLKIMTEKLEKL